MLLFLHEIVCVADSVSPSVSKEDEWVGSSCEDCKVCNGIADVIES